MPLLSQSEYVKRYLESRYGKGSTTPPTSSAPTGQPVPPTQPQKVQQAQPFLPPSPQKGWTPQDAVYTGEQFADPRAKKDFYSPGYQYTVNTENGLTVRQRNETIWLKGDPKQRAVQPKATMNLTGMATVQDAVNGTANWSDVSVEQRKKVLSDPNFYATNQITKYPKWMQQQILADPNFDWKKLPKWQEYYYKLSSSPAGMGAAQGLIMGAGNPLGAAAGGVLGWAAGKSGYDPTKEAWEQKNIASKGFGWLNFAAEQAEKVIGLGIQSIGAVQDPNTNLGDVFTKEGWNAGSVTFETIGPYIEDVPRMYLEAIQLTRKGMAFNDAVAQVLNTREGGALETLLGASGPVSTGHGNMFQAMDWAREEIKSGRPYREVMLELQTGISSQVTDMALQGVADPLNVMSSAQTRVGKAIAESTGHNVAAEAFTGTTGLGEAARKYKNLVQTGEALKIDPNFKVDQMGALSRLVAGVTREGKIKAGWFGDKGLLDAPTKTTKKNLRGYVENLTSLTPQSRASIGTGMFYENIGVLLSRFEDPHEAGKYLKALANNDMNTWKELGSRFAESPEFYTVLPALKDFNAGKLDAVVQAWDLAQPNRDALIRIADVLGESPSKLLDDLAARGTAEQDFQRISQRLQQSTDPGAKVLLDEIKAGKFTADTLKQVVDVFTGEGALPWHPGQWRAMMMDALGTHFDTWVTEKLMLGEQPEVKSAFFRTAALMKQAQSILLLGGSPGYAITNGLSNMVHRAATGVFGYLSSSQIEGWMDRLGVTPARMDEGVGIGGMVEQAATKTGVVTTEQTKALKGSGPLSTAKQMLSKISGGMPFSKLSSWFEKNEGRQAFAIGMKQFWNQSWRRGVGFQKMKPELIAALNDMGIQPERIYAAIEAGMNQKEIESILYGRFEGIQSRSLIDEAARRTGLSASQAADMLDKVGVLDTLDKYLRGQATQDGVSAAFRRAERVAQDYLDMQTAEDTKALAEHVRQKVGLEGAASGLDLIQKVNGTFFDTWMDHYYRFGEVMNDITLLDDPAMRGKAIEQAYEISDAEFRRVNARTYAQYQGIMEAWGYSGNPDALNILQALSDSDRIMHDAYARMREIRRNHFEKWKGDFDNPAKWDEWDANTREIDTLFKRAFEEDARAKSRMGQALGKIYEQMYGPAAGEAARKWWEDTTKFNDEMVQRERAFREEIMQARRSGVPGDLIAAQKQKYYQETKILQIAEAQRINEEGIARLERVIKNGGSGTPITPSPTGPTNPPTLPETPQVEAPKTPETPKTKQTPAEEINTLMAQAEQRKAEEARVQRERLSAVWDVAEEYARVGLPYDRSILQDKFALLAALRKPEYGGIESLTGLGDERVTPEFVREVLERRKGIKESEVNEAIRGAIQNANEAASNVRAPKVNGNTTILRAISEHGGIRIDLAKDLTGEKRPKSAPGVFTKKGVWIDEMARLLADDGYPIDLNAVDDPGGIRQATELINRARKGDKIYPVAHDYEAALARAQDEAAAKAFAESFDFDQVREIPFDHALWQREFDAAVETGDLTVMYEKIGELPEEIGEMQRTDGETWREYVSRVADEAAARVEQDARDTAIAEAMVRAEDAVQAGQDRADYAETRNLLKEKFQDVFGLTEEQAQAYMELSDAVAGWYERATGESGEAMYARYYKDVVSEGGEAMYARYYKDVSEGGLRQGVLPETGKEWTFRYLRNNEKAPNMGGRFGQDIEPSGRYLIEIDETADTPTGNYEVGYLTFKNPLVIEWGEGYQSGKNWKNVLSKKYGGKTGKRLSMAIKAEGYDGIVTIDGGVTSEIVDLGGIYDDGTKKALYQSAKGAVTFGADGITATIHAFEAADFSTLVHENAHVFRRMLADVAERTGNTQIKRDLSTIEEWAGVKDGVWTREAEEKFARGFERYVADGDAPTPRLKRAFESFKNWMVQIYKQITGSAIDVKLTDAVRQVFDRMLGAEEQVSSKQLSVNKKKVQEKAHSVDITDTMKADVMKGQPLFQEENPFAASLPAGALDETSQFLPHSEVMDEGWRQSVMPLLKNMEEEAIKSLAERPLDGAMRDMSPEGQKMLRQYLAGVKNDMATTKLATVRWGEQQRDFAMLNYNRRYGFDRWLDLVYPYQFFYSRSLFSWAIRALDKPAWYSNYARLKMQQQRYERDIPERLRNKIAIPAPWMPDWMGDTLYIDPLGSLFTPANFLKPFERMEADRTQQELEAERILQEWAADGTISQNEIQEAAQTRSGSAWERALAEAKIRREAEIANPADFFSTMFGPAWYLSTPLNLAGIKVPGISKGENKVSNLPLTNTARALDTVTQGTWAEPLGDLIGLLGKPEEWVRQQAGLPTLGEYGEYYTKRQIANMVAEGLISPEQAQMAMIEKQGEIWDQATERVKLELAMRVPTMGAIYAGLHGENLGEGLKGFGQAALPTLFGSGLLPEGELEYRGLKQEWNEAWAKYDRGDTTAVTEFFDEHPEYQAYLAKGKDDGELMKSFMIGQIWNRYMELGPTNQKQARAEMGDLFAEAFLNKETRSYETIPVETLVEWAQLLNGMTPSRYQTAEGSPFTETQPLQTGQKLNLYDPSVTVVTDEFFNQRKKYYPNYYELEQGYYALPKSKRSGYLLQNPQLKEYWEWKKKWYTNYPELQPIFSGKVFKRVDTSTWNPMLVQYVADYAYGGGKLGPGARKALEQQWILAGRPMDDLDTWIHTTVVPAMLYGP